MKKLIYLTILFLLIGIIQTKAQDKIYKKDGAVIEAKVTEIGTQEIKYKVFSNLNGPVYALNKSEVIKIIYENGSTENFDSARPAEELKRAQNIYVELGAQGLVFSANYDTRFGNKRNGLGGRIGIGGIGGSGVSVFTIPASLNYLLGNGKNFFEIGLGATFLNASTNDGFLFNDGPTNNSTVVGTMAFMYRLQPLKSGFSFRGGFTPIIYSGFYPYYGLSLGYTF